jgi:hypothetical protein
MGLVTNPVRDRGRLIGSGQHERRCLRLHWNLAVQDQVDIVFAEVFELALLQ